MLLYGKQLLYKNEVYDFDKRMSEIAALTRDDIMAAIQANFDFSKVSVASVGNLEKAIPL